MKSKDVNQLEIFGESKKRYIYAVIISLISPVSEEIQRRKENAFRLLFPTISIPFSHGHISLLDIEHDDDQVVVNKVAAAIKNQKDFEIQLKGVNIFVNGSKRSVYIPVVNPDPIQQLFDDLKTALNVRSKSSFNPHVTIVKSIPLSKFKLIEPVLLDYSFTGKFFCTEVKIIKKPVDDESAWNTVTDIAFPILAT